MKDVLEQLANDLEDCREVEGFCPSTKQSDDLTRYCPISEVRCEHRGPQMDLVIAGTEQPSYRCDYKSLRESEAVRRMQKTGYREPPKEGEK